MAPDNVVLVITIAESACTDVVDKVGLTPAVKADVPLRFPTPPIVRTTPPPSGKVKVPVLALMVVSVFLINLPSVPSNATKALLVELSGPITVPAEPEVIPSQLAVVPAVILTRTNAAPVDLLIHIVGIG